MPPVSSHVLAQRVAVYQACLQEGFAPVGTPGRTHVKTAIAEAARRLNLNRSTIRQAVCALPVVPPEPPAPTWTYPAELPISLRGATVMVAGDLHFWPVSRVPLSPIKSAFLQVARELQPEAIVFNGDLIDGTKVSRHPSILGQNPPKLIDEITAVSDYLLSLPAAAHRIVTMSNHDVRVDNYISNQAPELEGLCPRLVERLPEWKMAYSTVINGEVEIRHETGAGGIHVRHNNATRTGRTIITGHTHQLGVSPVYTRRGVHYGIECGMLAHHHEPQFEYTWGRPTRWQPGFVILTFDREGVLLPPELCQWADGRAIFRGKTVAAEARYRVRAASTAFPP